LSSSPATVQERRSGRPLARRLPDYLVHAALIAGALVMLFPFYWMVSTAVKSPDEANLFPPTLVPQTFQPEHFVAAWNMAPFARYFFNSGLVALSVVACVLMTSALSAYAFARFEFWGKNLVFMGYLATMMIPFEVIMIPNFIIVRNLGWYNTYLALIVPWGASVFGVFLLRQHFLNLPRDLWDAARMDGCGDFRYFLTIALPLARPALLTIGLLVFLGSWNGLLWPILVTSSEDLRVVQFGLSVFSSETFTRNDLLMAAGAITVAPIAVLYFFAQRQFVEGITSSGSKG
jgi:multiple sugar transport system permease protein